MIALVTILLPIYNVFAGAELIDEYILNFNSPIYVCSDQDSQAFVDTSQVEVQRYNETCSYMSGVINFLKGMEVSTMIEFVIEKEVGGSFEMVTSYDICDLCKELGDPESVYRQYLKCFGFPETCPFSSNSYPISDLVANTEDLPINSATMGRYQVTMNIYNNPSNDCLNQKTFIACLKIDLIIESL